MIRPMRALHISLLMLCGSLLSIGQGIQNTAKIEVKEVRPVQATGGSKLQQITISLDFPGRSSVYLDGYGEVPSKVNLTYITDSQHLVVRSSAGTVSLADQVLAPTAISMGSDVNQVPRDAFKYFGGNGPAPTTQHFRAVQADLLSQKFLLPPYVYTHNASTFSETLYHRLNGGERNLIVEVAAQLSFPSDSSTNAGIELKYAVRERRKGMDWQSELSSGGAQAASDFIVELMRDLTRSE
jgi:hypothetical protein